MTLCVNVKNKKGCGKVSLHPGMKFRYTKGKAKGRIGYVVDVQGNEILVKTSKSQYWCNRYELEQKVKWLKR